MREPWLAVLFSFLFPGMGQLYAGKRAKGVLFMLAQIWLCICFVIFLIQFSQGSGLFPVILICIFLVSLSLFNLFDAFRSAKQSNIVRQLERPAQKKDPFLAVFLSFLAPGLGQFYNGKWLKAACFFVGIYLIEILLTESGFFGPFIAFAFQLAATVWVMKDAYGDARAINGEKKSVFALYEKRNIYGVIIAVLLIPQIASVGFAMAIRNYIIRPYRIPVDSMAPIISKNDRILANQLIYRREIPKRGDLVVFHLEKEPYRKYVKRIVAMPGETLKIENGRVYTDGEPISIPQIPSFRVYTNRDDWPYGKKGQIIQIPRDSYFVLGDNSARSVDSRKLGFVRRQDIEGKAFYIYWPPKRWRRVD